MNNTEAGTKKTARRNLSPSTPLADRVFAEPISADQPRSPANADGSPVFRQHLMQNMYPKQIQKHVNRKMLNMEHMLEVLKVPARQMCGKEARRMSELSKGQSDAYNRLVHGSAHKKRKLLDDETSIKSALTEKGIEVENPVFDVRKVFTLPVRYRRRRPNEDKGTVSEFSCNTQSAPSAEDGSCPLGVPFDISPKLPGPENVGCEEHPLAEKFAEPELLFREIRNIQQTCQTAQETELTPMQCGGCKEGFGDAFENFAGGIEACELDKENNEMGRGEELLELSGQTPYVAPSFARVFSE